MENQQKIMAEETFIDGDDLLVELVGGDLDVYLSTLMAYVCEADPMQRNNGISKSFSGTVKRINTLSIEHINTAIGVLENDGIAQHPEKGKALKYFKKWSEERIKDQFGFDADSRLFASALEKMEHPSDEVAVWENRLATLSYAITYAVARSITYNALCLSARAYAIANMHEEAMDCLINLTTAYGEKQSMNMLREETTGEEDDSDGGIMQAS